MARAAASSARSGRRAAAGRPVVSVQLTLRECLPALLLLLGSLLSAMLVIQTTHGCRQLHAALQQLERQRWSLDEEHTRLLLQQGTLTAHRSIEHTAEQALHMRAPELEQRRVFVP